MSSQDHDDGMLAPDKTRKANVAELKKPASNQRSFLIEIYGPALGKNYPLENDEVTIGRDPTNTIAIDQENVSRRHCRIQTIDGSVYISDMESTNGTYVNDVPISRERLTHGDLVKIGRMVFKFISGGNIEGLYHEEIYRMTITDGLTQVANKRFLIDFLEREIPRAIRFGRPLSMLMLDIDHFKKINDDHGHLAGDSILKEICALLSRLVRKEELLARYGGEEFVIVLPETSMSTACTIAEKARRMVEQSTFSFAGSDISVTISIGVAELSPMAANAMDLIQVADEKLYAAKNSGRNCFKN